MQDTIAVEKTETLEQRIAAAIASPPASSELLLSLIVDIGVAVDAADQEANAAREQSLDPAIPDGEAAHERADVCMFRANRLHRSLDAIQALHNEAAESERVAQYQLDFDKAKAVRDNLASEFASRYSSIVTELVDLFGRISACNNEIDRIHAEAPEGSGYKLRHVEGAARGLDVPDSILANIRLPELRIGEHGDSMAYPTPGPTLSFGMLPVQFPRSGGDVDADSSDYEVVLGPDGYYTMARRADAPPLPQSDAQIPVSMREQALAEQAARSAEREKIAAAGREDQRMREFTGA